tara:strand:+ start:91 stop:279 length:189 start_codon:yes stop_codon:yes gene_type:complete
MKKTKKNYEEYLNDLSPEQGSEEWIIGGTIRMAHMWQNKYGTSIRKYDSIRFQVGYNEWKKQ